jgi:hypothetical protein
VRAYPLSQVRLYVPLAIALIMSAGVFFFSAPLLTAHGRLTQSLLKFTSIPITGEKPVEVFPLFQPVTVPDVPFPSHRANPMRTTILFGASFIGLVLIYRRIPLGRNFVVFVAILLCAAAGVILLTSTFYFDSAMYSQIWLRAEVLVWLLLPWMSAFVFVLVLPSVLRGIAWSVLLQAYVIVWSAVRLAFCLGTMHFTGILYLPLLWFCLGILFDLVCLVFFYSLALHHSLKRVEGERVS